MRKWPWISGATLFACSFVVFKFSDQPKPPDPIFKGQSASQWIEQLGRASDGQAKFALIDMGASAVPRLTAELERWRSTALRRTRSYIFIWEQMSRTRLTQKLRESLPMPPTDADLSRRAEILQILGSIGANSALAIPQISDAVRETNSFLHHFAIQSLGNIGPPARDAIPILTSCLDSPDLVAQRSAAFALAQIGMAEQEALKKLSQTAHHSNQWISAFSSMALWKLDPNSAHSMTLSNWISSGDPTFRSTLIGLLPRIAPQQDPLVQLLLPCIRTPNQDPTVQSNALRVLKLIAPASVR